MNTPTDLTNEYDIAWERYGLTEEQFMNVPDKTPEVITEFDEAAAAFLAARAKLNAYIFRNNPRALAIFGLAQS
jgi:hypothetical protein